MVCIQLTSFVTVQEYFVKRKSFAMGVITSGFSIGALTAPPLVVFITERYGLHGLFMIYASIVLQTVWMGALLRPLQTPKAKTDRVTMIESIDLTNGDLNVETSRGERVVVHPQKRRSGLPGTNGFQRESQMIDADDDANDIVEIIQKQTSQPNNAKTPKKVTLMKVLGLKPCTDPAYLLFVIGLYLMHTGHLLPFTFLPLRGLSVGATEKQAALLMTCMAATSFVFRLVAGCVGDCMPRGRRYLTPLAIIANGMLSIGSALVVRIEMIVAYAFGFGFFGGKQVHTTTQA